MSWKRTLAVILIFLLTASPLQASFAVQMLSMSEDSISHCCVQTGNVADGVQLGEFCTESDAHHGDHHCNGECSQCGSCVSAQMIQSQTLSGSFSSFDSIYHAVIPLLSIQQDTELQPPILSA